jgi:hypothetical protein
VLFINPYHSDYLIQIEMAGKWFLLEGWKRQLANLAEEYAVPLWDFNAFDQYSTETPPPLNEKHDELRWFWEPAHYRHELGDLMLASMLDRQCGNRRWLGKVGVDITGVPLQHQLDELRWELHEFIVANPEVIKRLKKR